MTPQLATQAVTVVHDPMFVEAELYPNDPRGTILEVYRSLATYETDPPFQPVAELLSERVWGLLSRRVVVDELMAFGRAEESVYLLIEEG